jgi:hypothetical protein
VSRNLTYLGSPYQQGTGNATVMPTGDVGAAFMQSMKDLKTQRQKEIDDKEKKKQEAKKTFEDYSIDYYIGHQKYFTEQLKSLRDESAQLMVGGVDFSDMSNPQVAELWKKKAKLANEAKLSVQIKELASDFMKLKPAEISGLSKTSYAEMFNFLTGKTLDEQLAAVQSGGMPQLKPAQKLPFKDIQASISAYSAVPFTLMEDQKALDAERDKSIESFKKQWSTLLTPEMFEDFADKDAAKKAYIEEKANEIKRVWDDKGKRADLAVKKAKDALDNKPPSDKVRVNYQRFVNQVASGSDSAIVKLAEYAMMPDGQGNPIKPEVRYGVKAVAGQTLQGVDKARLPGNRAYYPGEYIVIDYPGGQIIPIRMKDEDGKIVSDFYDNLYELVFQNFATAETKGATDVGLRPGTVIPAGQTQSTPAAQTKPAGGGTNFKGITPGQKF